MNRLRVQVIALTCWLVVFFDGKQLSNPSGIRIADYAVVLAVIIAVLCPPRIGKIPARAVVPGPFLIFLVYKIWAGGFLMGKEITNTIFESVGIIVATLLAYWLGITLRKYECTKAKSTISGHDRILEQSSDGLGYIYREVRRARNHQHPLALLAIAINEKSTRLINNRLLHEGKLEQTQQDMLSGVAITLCGILEDCALIVQGDDHFLVALPDTRSEEVPIIIDRLRRWVADQVGVELMIGSAALPCDGYTFEGLADKATREMKANQAFEFHTDSQRSPAETPMVFGKLRGR